MAESRWSFQLGSDGRSVMASWPMDADPPEADAADVRQHIEVAGYGDCLIDHTAIVEMLQQLHTEKRVASYKIGERHDGLCVISISEDRMEARLTLERPHGGRPVSAAQLRASLEDAGVFAGEIDTAVASALEAGVATGLVVARARAPVDGQDSRFESLIPLTQDRRPHLDADGLMDYRDLGSIPGVAEGVAVMRRVAATSGVDGLDLAGHVLKAFQGRTLPFDARLRGVRVDPGDPNVLVSTMAGRPVLVRQGIHVEPVIDVPQVDMSTGNIDFEGSVTVLGDVMPRMKIHATGDVLVMGTVAAAEIDAGGQVVVRGGVKGAPPDQEDDGSAPSHAGTIRCRGSFHARFVEYADIHSESDIVIDDHALFSTLTSARHVLIGNDGGRGQVLGGTLRAVGHVTATRFGGPSNAVTLVHAGLEPKVRHNLEHLDHEIASFEAEGAHGVELDLLRAEAAKLRTQLAVADYARVAVGRMVYPGTQIWIGARRWSSNDEHTSGVFREIDGDIQICPQ